MNELFNIKDNVTVITGGTGVLGRTIAKYLAKMVQKLSFLVEKKTSETKSLRTLKKKVIMLNS